MPPPLDRERRADGGGRILVVDDDPHVREALRDVLDFAGYAVVQATDGKAALAALEAASGSARDAIDLVLLDLEMPRVGGLEALRHMAEKHGGVPVVVVSGKGTVRSAVEATQLGAYDFLEKPVDAQRTLLTVRNALGQAQLKRERDALLADVRERYRMVGTSPAMQRVYRLIDKAAKVPSKVLVTGESGTGKERVARAIHLRSARAAGPFVAVNCAALPEDLVESELFGHEKGAFTGAVGQKPGAFEQANGGTLFLDEIGDMTLLTQAKVLRVLEESRLRRVGGTSEVSIDARIVAATNRDLRAEVEAGNFREDLYWRLNVVAVHLPPLRERKADVPALVEHFLAGLAEEHRTAPKQIDRGALSVLVGHDWPGNVRELRNAVERLAVMADAETISAPDVRAALRSARSSGERIGAEEEMVEGLREAREAFEQAHIRSVLLAHEGRVQEAADALGIDRTSLWRKMQALGVEAPS